MNAVIDNVDRLPIPIAGIGRTQVTRCSWITIKFLCAEDLIANGACANSYGASDCIVGMAFDTMSSNMGHITAACITVLAFKEYLLRLFFG